MANPPQYALISRHLGTCRLLIETGADPNIEPDIRGYVFTQKARPNWIWLR